MIAELGAELGLGDQVYGVEGPAVGAAGGVCTGGVSGVGFVGIVGDACEVAVT